MQKCANDDSDLLVDKFPETLENISARHAEPSSPVGRSTFVRWYLTQDDSPARNYALNPFLRSPFIAAESLNPENPSSRFENYSRAHNSN